ncbi:glycosyltransferase [Paenibacillus sp. Marseille-Q4541]|uniref:glycosyltransferase family 2 protein n=1 Tax=Paenibacillus sp. Marseille-Q4541 TaxID=2831522 RepID=UPI00201848C6|nr:glycosyltransferase [Paenibacillus sp. Marseille-Q4541]
MRQTIHKKTIPPRKRNNKSAKRNSSSQVSPVHKSLRMLGIKEGISASKNMTSAQLSVKDVHAGFTSWYFDTVKSSLPYSEVRQIAEAYRHSFYGKKHDRSMPMLLPLSRPAAAVVSASDEEDTLGAVLKELSRLPLQEIIVVLNGCSDNSYTLARAYPLVTIIHEPERIGHDVGRAMGAQMTTAESILFTDGDIVIKAEQLAPFLYAVDQGVDMALNDLRSFLPSFVSQDGVTRLKSYLNTVMKRPDLGASSLISVPHAISRACIQTIGYPNLITPPLAQTIALEKGCRVEAVAAVDVISKNRRRIGNVGKGNEVERMIIGDHLEALTTVLKSSNTVADELSISRAEVASWRNAK